MPRRECYNANMKYRERKIQLAVLAGTMLVSLAAVGEFRVEGGKIVVDSPFDLEIGSAEYAKALGDGVKSHASVRKDSKTGAMATNWYHSAKARLAQPYFGAKEAWLSFDDEGKTLSNLHLSIGDEKKGFDGRRLTFDDCRKKFDEVATDMSIRFGEGIDVDDDATEADALESLAAIPKGCPASGAFATSFRYAKASITNKYGDVEYSLTAMIHHDKTYSVNLSVGRPFRLPESLSVSRDDGYIPVYTNKSHSSAFLLRTPEQEKAHKEAGALRAMIKRLFDVDLDAPSITNDTSAALMTLTNSPARPEWLPLARPFAGCTEQKADRGVRILFIPVVNFGIRHAFDGDVGEEELKAESQRILDELERELGAKIPTCEKPAKETKDGEIAGATPPAFGDFKAMITSRSGTYFKGGIGDISVSIKYAVPSYVKRDGKYEVARRGAVVMEIMQSQIVDGPKKGK